MELLLCIIVYECVLAMQTIHIHKCISLVCAMPLQEG